MALAQGHRWGSGWPGPVAWGHTAGICLPLQMPASGMRAGHRLSGVPHCGGLEAEAPAERPGLGELWGEDRAEKRRPPGVSSGRWWAQCPGCRWFRCVPAGGFWAPAGGLGGPGGGSGLDQRPVELCLGRGAAPHSPRDGSAQSPLSEMLGVSEPTSTWSTCPANLSPCPRAPQPAVAWPCAPAAFLSPLSEPGYMSPGAWVSILAASPAGTCCCLWARRRCRLGEAGRKWDSDLTWGTGYLAVGWLRGASLFFTRWYRSLSAFGVLPEISLGVTDVVLQHPAHSQCPRCGCVWNCQNLTVSVGPGLLDSVVGVRGSFISEPSSREKGGETHPAGKKVACEQGARLGALA